VKKAWLLTLFIVLFLSACGTPREENGDYATQDEEDFTPYEDVYEDDEIYTARQMVEVGGIMREIMPVGSLSIEHFLEDIDYMIYVLKNNFPLLDVAYWARGINYKELAAGVREAVLAMEEPCEDTFLAILTWHFMPLFGTGHFMILDQQVFDNMDQNIHYGGYSGQKWMMNRNLLRFSPLANRFYERGNQERIDAYEAALDRLLEVYGMPSNRFWSDDRIRQPVNTSSIEENRIAYISAGRSMEELRQNQAQISNFFTQITAYEHLIIDLRGNSGGNADHFLNILLAPLLREPIESPNAFLFFFDEYYVRRFGDHLFQPTIYNGFMTIFGPYRPVNEILADYELPHIRHGDVERFHYGAPAGRFRNIEPTGDAPVFDGKIWLLTDPSLGSAAQRAVWYAKEAGHITLVGDITGGCIGGPRTLAFMPNTGIIFYFDIFYITDSRGRPLEAGTIPHHFNRSGMDALETVLALIAEGDVVAS